MAGIDEGDPLALDRQLCFSLYTASRALTGLYREILADLELTYPQYLVMLVLWERETLPVKELGLALSLDSGTLSPLLRRMEGAGLLTRRRGPQDERIVHVSITEEGVRLRERAGGIPERVLRATDLPPARLAELQGTLDHLTRAVSQATGRGAARAPCDTDT
ncbi:MarR family transcriptional regulator [Nocardiopsis exhalans]|uniref:DNA-binding MarR family transcriptional regulator n=2 Tax=Nocardiopsis TaxID=2013 RepID=A0A840W3E3_9ACTN|nr:MULTISPECIES: MarR family transcriptional regulator [Nocardiopsis]MBB5490494.1 DNA-binding MarR family transcriptional regulator [Nocardiopsis metallicus]USY22991.1 MarR family transcriptional regulator [Nocardiopsis exhalans]